MNKGEGLVSGRTFGSLAHLVSGKPIALFMNRYDLRAAGLEM